MCNKKKSELPEIDVLLGLAATMVREISNHDQEHIEILLDTLSDNGFPEIGAMYHLGGLYLVRRDCELKEAADVAT